MLKEQIKNDVKQAMLSRNEEYLLPLRMVVSQIQNYEIQKGGAGYEATDEEVVGVIEKQIKQRRESAEAYRNAGRDELAVKEDKEAEILSKYLPAQMSEQEIDLLIDDVIKNTGASSAADMGRVMSHLMPHIKGKADGAVVSAKVKSKLGG